MNLLRSQAGSFSGYILAWTFLILTQSAALLLADSRHVALQERTREFLASNCFDCHRGTEGEGGLDLTGLSEDLSDSKIRQRWVRILDRVESGEMPPPEAAVIPPPAKADFVRSAGDWLRGVEKAEQDQLGRVRGRRLTRREIVRSLHDLLGIDIPLLDHLPQEAGTNEFSTVADGQAMSHFQMERHLAAVDAAWDEAFERALSLQQPYERDFDAIQVARRSDRKRTREPEMIDGRAVTWSSGLTFYGRIPATTAPRDGWYRFQVRVSGLKPPSEGGVWTTVRSGICVSSAPLLAWIGAFEATSEPRDLQFEAWLPKGHMLEIRPGDTTLKKARFAGGQVGNGEGDPQDVPGIAIDRITMKQFHRGPDDQALRKLLFGDVPLEQQGSGDKLRPVTESPLRDATRLLKAFARRAFRRPVTDDELTHYAGIVQASLDEEQDLAAALRVGYRAILCSPRFLYFTESPGPLDDYAIASRLSYFLTGSIPDDHLAALADNRQLKDPAVLEVEAERLLSGPLGRRFVEDFAAEWLDLDQIDFTEPDRKLVPDFDPIVQHSMLEETHTFLETMLRDNLSVTHLVNSDFTFLNSRLARFYEIDGVTGDELRRVALEPDNHRGGVLTQGAILKVTANGSNTSPVVRGVWVSERLLGTPIPPPPDNVPAIEPDIRGASTIREILAKHRSQDSCASCHVKIDPPGFALENFDPAGRWRDRYVRLVSGKRDRGPAVDASYTMPDGRSFRNIDDLKSLLAADTELLARNLAAKLLVFGTGATISFADREAVADIVERAAAGNYGFRSVVKSVVTSPVFLSK